MRTRTPLLTIMVLALSLARAADAQITDPLPAPVEKRGLMVEIRDVVRLPRTLGRLHADQDVNPSSRFFRLAFELDKQIHSIAGSGAAIENVADNYQVSICSNPVSFFVDYPGVLQRRDHWSVRAVNVGECHDSRYIIVLPGFCRNLQRQDHADE